MKTTIRIICFVLIGILLFIPLQRVMTPNHNEEGNPFYSVTGMEKLPEDSIDVLFFGTSQCLEGVSPIKIYKDTGIHAYNAAISGSTLSESYYLLERLLRTQHPQVLVLDVSSLYRPEVIGAWRYVLDNLPLDVNKYKAAKAYESLFAREGESAVSVLFPIVKYHTRWSELSEKDLTRELKMPYYSMGQFVTSGVIAASTEITAIDQLAAELYRSDPGKIPLIPDNSIVWLDKICSLCNENKIDIILIRLPGLISPDDPYGRVSWNMFTHMEVKYLARKSGLPFIDMNYDVDTGVDFATDSEDGGVHLNLRGAEKVSAFLAGWLSERYVFPEKNDPLWQYAAETYDKVRELGLLHSTLNFREYLSALPSWVPGRILVVIAKGEYSSGLEEEDYLLLEALGLDKIRTGDSTDAYCAILDGDKVVYQQLSDEYSRIINSEEFATASTGFFTASLDSIIVDGIDYSVNSTGLNIFILDKQSGLPMDKVAIDTRYADNRVNHLRERRSLRGYEEYLMQQDYARGIR